MRLMALAVLAFAIGCSKDTVRDGVGEVAEISRERETPNIHEVVFRHLFDNNGSAVKTKADSYFLSIEGKDPSAEFLKRFSDHKPPVRLGSAFKERKGIKFTASSLKWIDDNAVEVHGGYYEGDLSSSGSVFRVARKDSKWVVERKTLQSVS